MIFPELGQGKSRRAADENVGVELAFFILRSFRISVVRGEAATSEDGVGLLAREPDDDECSGRWGWEAAQIFGVGGADGFGEVVGAAQDINGAVLTIVGGSDPEVRLLVGRKRVANLSDGADEVGPADFFAQVVTVARGRIA